MMSQPQSHRRRSNVRRANVTACVRCKSRKQRCDQNVPACSNCEKVGAECISTDGDGRVVPRSYVRSLEDRVAHLEMKLAAHGIQDDGTVTSPAFKDNTPLSTGSPSKTDDPASFEPRLTFPGQLPMLKLVLPNLEGFAGSSASGSRNARYQSLVDTLPFKMDASMPSLPAARELAAAYFEYSDKTIPILSRAALLQTLESAYRHPPQGTQPPGIGGDVRMLMVFATAICLVNQGPGYPPAAAEAYFSSAMQAFSKDLAKQQKHDVEHLEKLLLVIQYTSLASNLPISWHFLGLALRLAIGLGLHADQDDSITASHPDVLRRRRLFWATYSFDRALAIVLHRPLGISEEAVETPLPNVMEGGHEIAAHYQLLFRRLESEIYQTLSQKEAVSGAVLDFRSWRKNVETKLLQWAANRPQKTATSKLAPDEVLGGMLACGIVLLYLPSRHLPTLFEDEMLTLATQCIRSIECYQDCFKKGYLAFYWRTCHNVFRSGVALIYCMRSCQAGTWVGISMEQMRMAVSTCATVLWGMVERYSTGKPFRDVFDELAASASRPLDQQPDVISMALDHDFSEYMNNSIDEMYGINFDQQSIDAMLCGLTAHPLPGVHLS